jgi:hypothetical protein
MRTIAPLRQRASGIRMGISGHYCKGNPPVETLLGILFIGVMLYLANYQDATGTPIPVVTPMMNSLVMLMGFLTLTMLLQVVAPQGSVPQISLVTGVFLVVIAGGAIAVSAGVVNSPAARLKLAALFERRKPKIDGSARPYNPDSTIHTAAVLLAMFALVYYAFIFVVAGGLEGIAEALTQSPPHIGAMLTDFAVNTAIALLGVGLFLRRNVQQTLIRLKLRFSLRDIQVGLVAGAALFVALFLIEQVIYVAAPPEMLSLWNAPAKALFDAFKDALLINGLIMALVYGISEEILYRGALQPVFGFGITAVFFTLIHLQYLFTPYMLLIFVVALTLGYLRQRYSTTAAMTAHLIYNLLPFLLAGFLPGVF